MAGLWANFARAFSEEVSPVSLLRKFARTSWRWMDVYRRGLPPAISAFAAKQYHGHWCVPPTIDALVDEFKAHNRHAAAVKLEVLVADAAKQRAAEANKHTVDPSTIHPDKFIGQWIKKEFEGFGNYRGQVVAHDIDMLENVIYRIRYLDGDEEDLFLRELILYIPPDELLSLIN